MPGGSRDSLFYRYHFIKSHLMLSFQMSWSTLMNSYLSFTYYSFNIGKAHIISFSTEVYYYYQYEEFGWLQIINQYKWLEEDLKVKILYFLSYVQVYMHDPYLIRLSVCDLHKFISLHVFSSSAHRLLTLLRLELPDLGSLFKVINQCIAPMLTDLMNSAII